MEAKKETIFIIKTRCNVRMYQCCPGVKAVTNFTNLIQEVDANAANIVHIVFHVQSAVQIRLYILHFWEDRDVASTNGHM